MRVPPGMAHLASWLADFPAPGESVIYVDCYGQRRTQTVLGYATGRGGLLGRNGRLKQGVSLDPQPKWVDGISVLLYVRGEHSDHGCPPTSPPFRPLGGQLQLFDSVEDS